MKLLPGPDYFRDNIMLRNDTLLGGCQAIGDDLGFNPDFLRIPLAAGIMFAPLWMIGIYLSLCLLAFVSRTFFPTEVQRAAPAVTAEQPVPQPLNETVELPRAA